MIWKQLLSGTAITLALAIAPAQAEVSQTTAMSCDEMQSELTEQLESKEIDLTTRDQVKELLDEAKQLQDEDNKTECMDRLKQAEKMLEKNDAASQSGALDTPSADQNEQDTASQDTASTEQSDTGSDQDTASQDTASTEQSDTGSDQDTASQDTASTEQSGTVTDQPEQSAETAQPTETETAEEDAVAADDDQVADSSSEPTGGETDQTAEENRAEDHPLLAMTADEIKGRDVYDRDGEEIGAIDDVAIDTNNELHVIVSFGGFLGIGDTEVSIPLKEIEVSDDKLVLPNYTQAEIENEPDWDEGDGNLTLLDGSEQLSTKRSAPQE